jgi:type VI secretion system protein
MALLLLSCTSTKNIELTPFTLQSINVIAEADANNGRPIPLDVVFTRDRETLKDLEGFTASGWNSVKGTNLGNWEGKIVSKSFEVGPGQQVQITEFPEGYADALGIVVYANYNQPGLHRLVFTEVREIELILGKMTLLSENGKPYLLTSPPEAPQRNQQARY